MQKTLFLPAQIRANLANRCFPNSLRTNSDRTNSPNRTDNSTRIPPFSFPILQVPQAYPFDQKKHPSRAAKVIRFSTPE